MRLLLITALALLCLSSSMGPSVEAQPADDVARVFFERAVAHVDAGRIPEALDDFESSFAATPRSRTLFNIVLLLSSLDRLPEALDAADALGPLASAEAMRGEGRGLTTHERAQLRDLRQQGSTLARYRLGFDGRPANTTIVVDGVPRRWVLGDPAVVWLAPNAGLIEVRVGGQRRWHRTGPFSGGSLAEESVVLEAPEHTAPLTHYRVLVARSLIVRDGRAALDVVGGTSTDVGDGALTAAALVDSALGLGVQTPEGVFAVTSVHRSSNGLARLSASGLHGRGTVPHSDSTELGPATIVTHVSNRQEPLYSPSEVVGAERNGTLLLDRGRVPAALGAAVLSADERWVGVVIASTGQVESRPPWSFTETSTEERQPWNVRPDGSLPPLSGAPAWMHAAILWNAYVDSETSDSSAEYRRARGEALDTIESSLAALEPEFASLPFYRQLHLSLQSARAEACNNHDCDLACSSDSMCGEDMRCDAGVCSPLKSSIPVAIGVGAGRLRDSDATAAIGQLDVVVEPWSYAGRLLSVGPLVALRGRVGTWRGAIAGDLALELGGSLALGRRHRARIELVYAPGQSWAEGRSSFSWRAYRVAFGLQTPGVAVLLEYSERGRRADDTLRGLGLQLRFHL